MQRCPKPHKPVEMKWIKLQYLRGFLGDASGKELACQWSRHKRCGFDCWVRKIP